MLQKINLYSHLAMPAPIITFITWRRFWIINYLLITMYLIIYLFLVWDNHSLQNERDSTQIQARALEKTFLVMKATYPAFLFTADSVQVVQELKKEILTQQRILELVSNHVSFSQELLLISSLTVKNLWLNGINIIDSGTQVNLKGYSLGNNPIENFLSNLSNEPLFRSYTLTINNIEELKKSDIKNQLVFEITLLRNAYE